MHGSSSFQSYIYMHLVMHGWWEQFVSISGLLSAWSLWSKCSIVFRKNAVLQYLKWDWYKRGILTAVLVLFSIKKWSKNQHNI